MHVGVIGAGRMGLPVVRRLVAGCHDVRVLARSARARTELAGESVTITADVAATVRNRDVVLLSVLNDEQVRDIALDGGLIEAMNPGSVLVVHTTGSPRTVARIATHAGAHRVHVIDAPFSGGPHDIAAGAVTLFAGGEAHVIARLRPLFATYADPILYVGRIGAGQRVKLLNNAIFAAHVGLLLDTGRLARLMGVEVSALLAALPRGSADSRALRAVAARGSAVAFAGTAREFLIKDLDVVRDVLADLGGDLGAFEGPLAALAGAVRAEPL
jgi:3-hydroxyisobutyrate dehydrogenase-like beta-hydroxyacid dehydrogenase